MKNKGFSLVELIVVIAIMAILVGVAVPVYTSYIEKTEIAKDKQLVDEVAHALQVYAAGNFEAATDDYVVLTPDGASALEGGFAEAAMKATFGENWKNDLALEYENWTDNGVLAQVLANAASAGKVADSTFVQNSTPGEMLSAVSTVTNALGGMAVTAGSDPLETLWSKKVISEDQYNRVRAELTAEKLSWAEDSNAYGIALSNILVKEVSKEAGAIGDGAEASMLLQFASTYSYLYGWASTSDKGAVELEALNAEITRGDANTDSIIKAFSDFNKKNASDPSSEFVAYLTKNGETDGAAFATIMKTVGNISDEYDMTVNGVYTSEVVANQLNDYINTVVAVAELNDDQITALSAVGNGDVVVFVTKTGAVSVIPANILTEN